MVNIHRANNAASKTGFVNGEIFVNTKMHRFRAGVDRQPSRKCLAEVSASGARYQAQDLQDYKFKFAGEVFGHDHDSNQSLCESAQLKFMIIGLVGLEVCCNLSLVCVRTVQFVNLVEHHIVKSRGTSGWELAFKYSALNINPQESHTTQGCPITLPCIEFH